MSTEDKDQIIAALEHLLTYGEATLSPNMLELIHVTIDTLKDGPQPLSHKALNTWVNMLNQNALPPKTRKQVLATIILLRKGGTK